MSVPIFQIPKTQISSSIDDEFVEKNAIFNLNLSIPETKELLKLENLFDEKIKKNKKQNRNSHICEKNKIAHSDDDNFWRAAMINFDSIENGKKNLPSR